MVIDGARETARADGELAPDRESGVVKIVEREARPVEGAVELGVRSPEREIETDLEGGSERKGLAASKSTVDREAVAAAEETIIEVSDDEIEAADPFAPRQAPAAPHASNPVSIAPPSLVQRSRPPARPSLRPRPPLAASSLPPPLRQSLPPPPPLAGGSLQTPGIPREDPWVRANLALELSRARARILELEEQVAYRDARILTLEERLEAAERKLEELGGPGSQGRTARLQGAASRGLEVTKVQRAVSTSPGASVAPMQRRGEQPLPAAAQPASGKRTIPMPQARVSKVEVSAARKDAELRPSAASAAPRPLAPKANVESARPQGATAEAGASQLPAARVGATNEASRVAGAQLDAIKSNPEATNSEGSNPEATNSEAKSAEPDISEAKSAEPDMPDDGELRRIAGIGPRFEAALRKQGITRLSQVAAWSEADLRQVAKALKIPKSRIVKGRWVESAREAIGASRVSE